MRPFDPSEDGDSQVLIEDAWQDAVEESSIEPVEEFIEVNEPSDLWVENAVYGNHRRAFSFNRRFEESTLDRYYEYGQDIRDHSDQVTGFKSTTENDEETPESNGTQYVVPADSSY